MKLAAKIRTKVKSRFFENEAELSGSDEGGSDEDLDLREEDDVMMEEDGDQDELPDDEELIQQIGQSFILTLEHFTLHFVSVEFFVHFVLCCLVVHFVLCFLLFIYPVIFCSFSPVVLLSF